MIRKIIISQKEPIVHFRMSRAEWQDSQADGMQGVNIITIDKI